MAELRYDISVIGEDKLKRAIRSIDQELLAHQRRMRMTGGSMSSTARRGGGGGSLG